MLKNKKFVVFLSLFMIFVLTIPAFALEIQPLGMDCPNCSGIVSITNRTRTYKESRGSNCRDCSRNFSHVMVYNYRDTVTRCGGTCGYYNTSSRLINNYCNDN